MPCQNQVKNPTKDERMGPSSIKHISNYSHFDFRVCFFVLRHDELRHLAGHFFHVFGAALFALELIREILQRRLPFL